MCLASSLMNQEKILVVKANEDTAKKIIENKIYAIKSVPNNYKELEKFVLVDESGTNKARVLAIGVISKVCEIDVNSRSVNVFKNSECKWEYKLSTIVDLREDILLLDDIFIEEDLDKINYTTQF